MDLSPGEDIFIKKNCIGAPTRSLEGRAAVTGTSRGRPGSQHVGGPWKVDAGPRRFCRTACPEPRGFCRTARPGPQRLLRTASPGTAELLRHGFIPGLQRLLSHGSVGGAELLRHGFIPGPRKQENPGPEQSPGRDSIHRLWRGGVLRRRKCIAGVSARRRFRQ